MVRLGQFRWIAAALSACTMCFAFATALGQEKTADHGKEPAKAETPVDEHKAAASGEKSAEEKPHNAHGAEGEDLSHANATSSLSDPTAFKSDAAIFTFIIFLVLLAILTKFAWKPIAHGLEAREKGIEDKIEQARVAAEKATEQLKEYEARLAAATQEAQQIVGEARKTAETAKEKILADAQALAQKEREKAVADITTAKNLALREIAEKSVDTAIGLARNIIRREVRPGDHEQLIKDALQQFPNN